MVELKTLAELLNENMQWQDQAACKGLDTDLFFHPDGERGASRRERAAAAKAVCLSCPVLKQCRSYALRAGEPYGVWGGMSEEERSGYLRAERESKLPRSA